MLSGKGGYDRGIIKEQGEEVITAPKVEDFLALLQREGFWSLSSGEPANEMGFDGSSWSIEAVRTNRYHTVSRWMPKDDAPVGRIGRCLVEMADWKIESLY